MALNKGMMSSKSSEWETPQELFDRLDAVHAFNTDVCATPDNAKCCHFFTKAADGLAQNWIGTCWMNPPYGREIGKWVKKAFDESRKGAKVVCLLPARTDTKWWHDYCIHGEIEFLRGRLKFSGSKNCAPFPSAIVIFSGEMKIKAPRQWDVYELAVWRGKYKLMTTPADAISGILDEYYELFAEVITDGTDIAGELADISLTCKSVAEWFGINLAAAEWRKFLHHGGK